MCNNLVRRSLRQSLTLALAVVIFMPFAHENTRADEASGELARKHLYAGTLVAGEAALATKINADGSDREARFGFGLVKFARAVERLGQSLYRYGLTPPKTLSIPLLRFSVPHNPTPEPITYEAFRNILKVLDDDLASAEAALQGVGDGDVGIVVDLARVRFDLRRDGRAAEDESLAYILSGLARRSARPAALEVRFDTGDAAWLAGYSHVLMGLCDFLLAHAFHTTYDAAFHRFFPRSETPLARALSQPCRWTAWATCCPTATSSPT